MKKRNEVKMKNLLCGVFSGLFLISCAFAAVGKSPLTVKVLDTSGARGQQVCVVISVGLVKEDIYGIDLQLEYNPAHLQFINAEAGKLTAKWNVIGRDNEAHDRISIGLYNSSPLPKSRGSITVINFMVKKAAPPGVKSSLRLKRADFNERPVKAVKDGKFTVLKK